MNADNHSGLKMLSGAAVQFAGAVLNELGRRSQPPHVPQQSRVRISTMIVNREHEYNELSEHFRPFLNV
jgi:hypothetical protein